MDISPKEFFAALAHDTRLRCLLLLLNHEELCVCELTHSLSASQPHISRHLAHLRELGLILDRREGLWIYYRVNTSIPQWTRNALQEIGRCLSATTLYQNDEISLVELMEQSGATRCA